MLGSGHPNITDEEPNDSSATTSVWLWCTFDAVSRRFAAEGTRERKVATIAAFWYPATQQAWKLEAAMNALAGSVLISMIFAGAASVMSAPRPADRSIREFRPESAAFDRQTTPIALEQRFGRDTILYFPMDKNASAPVALEQLISRVR